MNGSKMTDEPGCVETATPDLAAEKLAALKELFPGAVADGVLDAARIGELVDLPVAGLKDGRERYGLMWAGKQEAVASLLRPSRGTLVPDLERSVDFENARNVFIEGDNLEVLKILQKAYNDQIKLIYIDPPYNTTNDFVYNDDFTDGMRAYLAYTGQTDDDGKRTSSTAEIGGRKHSGWLTMMYPRLVLARNLLKQDGLLAVSIDDNEVHSLRLLLDEVFGAENFVATLVWQGRTSVQNDTDISASHEYVILYARNRRQTDRRLKESNKHTWYQLPSFAAFPKPLRADRFANPDGDARGPWKEDPFDAPNVRPNLTYAITNPNTGDDHWPPTGRCWRTTEAEYNRLVAEDRISWGSTGTGRPKLRVYYEEKRDLGEVEITWWDGASTGTATAATKELQVLFDGVSPFDTPKPTSLLGRLLSLTTRGDDLVLDFFAGSGSTAHAVALQNGVDGGRRRVISVNIPEPTREGSSARSAGFEKVSDITLSRILKVAASNSNSTSAGLRVLSLSESIFVAPEPGDDQLALVETTLRSAMTGQGLAQEICLREGVRLDRPWATGQAKDADWYASGGVTVLTDLELTQAAVDAAIESNPRVLVFLEDAFAGKDDLKASAFFACKQAGVTMKTV